MVGVLIVVWWLIVLIVLVMLLVVLLVLLVGVMLIPPPPLPLPRSRERGQCVGRETTRARAGDHSESVCLLGVEDMMH